MMGALGIAVGATVYYLMSQRVEHKSEVAKHNTTALIRFLNPDERNIIDRIIQGNGRALQSELTRELGLSKVKIHRVVDKLKKRGIIFMSKYGKTNSIVLNKDLLEALK
ncbi:MAG TPA: winged helix-turn-helix transcriptional regulator [Candidatus Nanoarchaeia archaeon]|nr:winged helix-turn-helix transcriptional regulator [Candidatus Nanoarchaeia archaeon]